MQTAKNAMASVKQAAADLGASSQSGMEKTKATLQEKAEKMAAQHPAEKVIAEERKQERIEEAEIHKRQVMEYNAAATEQVRAGHTSSPAGPTAGQPPQTAASPVPGGQGNMTEGAVGTHPTDMGTSTARPSAADNPHAEGTEPDMGTGTARPSAADNPHAEGTEPALR